MTRNNDNYLKAKELAEYIRENPEIMTFKHLKKIETEFYSAEKAKQIKEELVKLINSTEGELIKKALHQNKLLAQNKSDDDDSDLYDPNDDWDAEAWHEIGVPTDEDGDPIGI